MGQVFASQSLRKGDIVTTAETPKDSDDHETLMAEKITAGSPENPAGFVDQNYAPGMTIRRVITKGSFTVPAGAFGSDLYWS